MGERCVLTDCRGKIPAGSLFKYSNNEHQPIEVDRLKGRTSRAGQSGLRTVKRGWVDLNPEVGLTRATSRGIGRRGHLPFESSRMHTPDRIPLGGVHQAPGTSYSIELDRQGPLRLLPFPLAVAG